MAPKIKNADQIYFTKDHQMVRKAVAEFIKKEINPNVDQWEEDEIAPLKDIFKKMGDLGFLGIRYDPQYGGQGLGYWYDLVFLEELGHIKALGLAVAITVQTHMATPAIRTGTHQGSGIGRGHHRTDTYGHPRHCRIWQ
jgi:citronellyl-CoA dehydrogenase